MPCMGLKVQFYPKEMNTNLAIFYYIGRFSLEIKCPKRLVVLKG